MVWLHLRSKVRASPYEEVTFKTFPGEDATQVGVPGKPNASGSQARVPGVRRQGIGNKGWDNRVGTRHLHFEHDAGASDSSIAVVYHFHFTFGQVIHTCTDTM